MAYTYGTTDLGNVKNIRSSKNANLLTIPLPFSDQQQIGDWLGTTWSITVSGEYSGDTTAINTFINSLNSEITGNQSVAKQIVLDPFITSADNVKGNINEFSWETPTTAPTYISYNIQFVIGANLQE